MRRSTCRWCDAPIRQPWTGRPRQFCSAGHRQQANLWFRLTGVRVSRPQLLGDGRCGVCGEAIDPELNGWHPDGLTIDHITPVDRGGSSDLSNLQPAHRRCNIAKGAA